MQANLRLTDEQFFNCLMMFYKWQLLIQMSKLICSYRSADITTVGYMVFILPVNTVMRVIDLPRQLGLLVVFFGVCGTCLFAVHNYGSVLGLRLPIGLGEAFVQVGLFNSSFWYKRGEVATSM